WIPALRRYATGSCWCPPSDTWGFKSPGTRTFRGNFSWPDTWSLATPAVVTAAKRQLQGLGHRPPRVGEVPDRSRQGLIDREARWRCHRHSGRLMLGPLCGYAWDARSRMSSTEADAGELRALLRPHEEAVVRDDMNEFIDQELVHRLYRQ